MTRTTRFPGKLIPLAILIAAALISSCDGGGGFLLPGFGRAWVAIEPVQCLGNPWEQDWLARHGNDYGSYPRDLDSQYTIIRQYYRGLGVEVGEIISVLKYEVVCAACSCLTGFTLYLNVREGDVLRMLRLGYRREDPPPSVRDTSLTGIFDYTGYDSSGAPLMTGTLTVLRVDSTYVLGTWNLAGPPGYGPQLGMGDFVGYLDGRMLTLNLNPGWADNNVMLHGEIHTGRYTGIWQFVTYVGPIYTGTFEAVKHGPGWGPHLPKP